MYEEELDRWLVEDRPTKHERLFSVLDKVSRDESLSPAEQQLLDDYRAAGGGAHAKRHRERMDAWKRERRDSK
jgi:hypothetical protein